MTTTATLLTMGEVIFWSLVAAMGTSIGAAGVYLIRKPTPRFLNLASGFAAGVMLGATFLSLLPASTADISPATAAVFLLIGAVSIGLLDRWLPHAHARQQDSSGWEVHHPDAIESETKLPRKNYLLASALTLHNIPEGMAVGAGFAVGDPVLGVSLAVAISLHNIPEGFAVVAPALGSRQRGRLFSIAALTGLVEIPAIIGAYLLASQISWLIAPTLAFAAGAMLYVIFDELLPDTYRERPRLIASAVISGIVVFMGLQSFVAGLI